MGIEEEFKKIEDKVKCGYLQAGILASSGLNMEGEPFQNEMITIECWNLKCGPKNSCDVYEGKSCEYRSSETNKKLLYKPTL